jgi:drug/metabolite transporter (DMT)-like permease
VLALCLLGVFGTGIANVLAATAAGRMGATRASGTTFIMPVVALLLGVLVRNEEVSAMSVIGVAICLAGAWILRQAQASSGSGGNYQPAPVRPQPSPRGRAGMRDPVRSA